MHLFSSFFLAPLPFSSVNIHLKDQIQPLHQKLLCRSGLKKLVLMFFINPTLHWFLWASIKSHHFPCFYWTSKLLLSCPNKDLGSTLLKEKLYWWASNLSINLFYHYHISIWRTSGQFLGNKKVSQGTVWKLVVYINRKHILEN